METLNQVPGEFGADVLPVDGPMQLTPKSCLGIAIKAAYNTAGRCNGIRDPSPGDDAGSMKVCFITREYPPNVYGGAGVHIKNLARELAQVMDVEVRCFGDQNLREGRLGVKGYHGWQRMLEGVESRFNPTLDTFATDLSIVRDPINADIVHTHTWYAAMAGFMAKMLYGVPLVATVHSLEPLRPWKEEQLGRSYHLTTWMERVALEAADRVIAVSAQSRLEILDNFNIPPERVVVIHNGVDLKTWKPSQAATARQTYGIEGDYILFVGRTTRQKGMVHLLDAMKRVEPGVRLVCCTSAPDTPEIEGEIAAKVKETPQCVWINKLLREEHYIELYSNCSVFACPSVYEPFGIINLEAMACERPVVASAVGGIPEVVVPERTGLLVPPASPQALADALNHVLRDRAMARRMGRAGRRRVEEHFSWSSIAAKTQHMYHELLKEKHKIR
jgi:alpha-maltose-1-phosphate synthase